MKKNPKIIDSAKEDVANGGEKSGRPAVFIHNSPSLKKNEGDNLIHSYKTNQAYALSNTNNNHLYNNNKMTANQILNQASGRNRKEDMLNIDKNPPFKQNQIFPSDYLKKLTFRSKSPVLDRRTNNYFKNDRDILRLANAPVNNNKDVTIISNNNNKNNNLINSSP